MPGSGKATHHGLLWFHVDSRELIGCYSDLGVNNASFAFDLHTSEVGEQTVVNEFIRPATCSMINTNLSSSIDESSSLLGHPSNNQT